MKEMELITGKENLKDFARESWSNMSTQILEQARLEAGHSNRIAVALKEVEGIYDGVGIHNIIEQIHNNTSIERQSIYRHN